MRLDKFLATKDICSRKEARKFIKKNDVFVEGKKVTNVTHKLNENDEIQIEDYTFICNEFKYIVMNKQEGCVCANNDDLHETVFDYIGFEDFQTDLFTVGRLDLDTTGLLIITNDGKFSHSLMSPKRHVDKTYHVIAKRPISDEDITQLEEGVTIDYDYHTMPAKVERLSENEINLTISEGKFHQVKRMLIAVGNEVTTLSRISIGKMTIPTDIEIGDYDVYSKQTLESLIYGDEK